MLFSHGLLYLWNACFNDIVSYRVTDNCTQVIQKSKQELTNNYDKQELTNNYDKQELTNNHDKQGRMQHFKSQMYVYKNV